MKKTKYALLVIDMQQVAFDGKITPPIINGQDVLNKVAELIRLCRQHDITVVFLQTCAYPGQPYAKDMHGWEIHPQVAPTPDDPIVNKVNSSGFDDTNLHEVLRDSAVSHVITCGIWSEACVTATTLSALDLGYGATVAADAHGTMRDNEAAALAVTSEQNETLSRTKARVLTVAQIAQNLSSAET